MTDAGQLPDRLAGAPLASPAVWWAHVRAIGQGFVREGLRAISEAEPGDVIDLIMCCDDPRSEVSFDVDALHGAARECGLRMADWRVLAGPAELRHPALRVRVRIGAGDGAARFVERVSALAQGPARAGVLREAMVAAWTLAGAGAGPGSALPSPAWIDHEPVVSIEAASFCAAALLALPGFERGAVADSALDVTLPLRAGSPALAFFDERSVLGRRLLKVLRLVLVRWSRGAQLAPLSLVARPSGWSVTGWSVLARDPRRAHLERLVVRWAERLPALHRRFRSGGSLDRVTVSASYFAALGARIGASIARAGPDRAPDARALALVAEHGVIAGPDSRIGIWLVALGASGAADADDVRLALGRLGTLAPEPTFAAFALRALGDGEAYARKLRARPRRERAPPSSAVGGDVFGTARV